MNSPINDEQQKKLENEIVEIYNKIINLCDGHSFPAIKASLLLTRDYFVKLDKEESNHKK